MVWGKTMDPWLILSQSPEPDSLTAASKGAAPVESNPQSSPASSAFSIDRYDADRKQWLDSLDVDPSHP